MDGTADTLFVTWLQIRFFSFRTY